MFAAAGVTDSVYCKNKLDQQMPATGAEARRCSSVLPRSNKPLMCSIVTATAVSVAPVSVSCLRCSTSPRNGLYSLVYQHFTFGAGTPLPVAALLPQQTPEPSFTPIMTNKTIITLSVGAYLLGYSTAGHMGVRRATCHMQV